jgi:hypothetical protein
MGGHQPDQQEEIAFVCTSRLLDMQDEDDKSLGAKEPRGQEAKKPSSGARSIKCGSRRCQLITRPVDQPPRQGYRLQATGYRLQ